MLYILASVLFNQRDLKCVNKGSGLLCQWVVCFICVSKLFF